MRSSAPVPREAEQLDGLTVLRGLAAFGVVLFHYADEFPALAPFTYWTRHFYMWVDLFFILSGFVMVHVYGEAFARFSRAVYRDFLVRRLARIYPLHLVTLLAVVGLEAALLVAGMFGVMTPPHEPFMPEPFSVGAILTNLLMIQSWGVHEALTWNGPAWSISCEWLMYLLFPLLLAGVRRVPWWLAAGFGLALYVGLYAMRGTLDLHYDFGVPRALAGFVTGMALHAAVSTRVLPRRWLWLALVWIGLCAGAVLPDIAYVPGFVIMVAACARMRAEGVLGRAGRWAGDVSYSLYLWHVPVLMVLPHVTAMLLGPEFIAGLSAWQSSVALVAVLVLLSGAAEVSYRWIEKPAREWIRRRMVTD